MNGLGTASRVMQMRAFNIADEAMLDMLQAHCVYEDAPLGVVLAPVDPQGNRVQRIQDAERAAQEAFAWLRARGFAGTTRSPRGYLLITVDLRPDSAKGFSE